MRALPGVYVVPSAPSTFDQRVWGSTYWGGRTSDPLREREGEYVVALVNEALDSRHDLFTAFSDAVRTGDVESAYLLSLQAQATPIR